MKRILTLVSGAILAFAGILAFGLIGVFPFMWLWNWLAPEMFGLKELDFWHALALLWVSGMLFRK